jgi:uncharacterized membrane protein YadS
MENNEKPVIKWNEDWAAVAYGFIIIAFALASFNIPSPVFAWKNTDELLGKVFSIANLQVIGKLFLMVYIIAVFASASIGKNLKSVALGLPVVFLLCIIALIIAGNSSLKSWNLEAVIISLTIGLLISNFFTLPLWLKESLNTEIFVKIGLVILGSSIIFGEILKAGALGLVQALIVVISVWYFAFWLCKKMGIDEEMAIMLSSAVSICGVSAAIATAGAIKGDPKKLSYIISLVLITAIPMIIFMPLIASALGLSDAVAGAWLGGTIDTTGAVIASGTLVGDEALKVSTIVKFSQNVLLGLAAFAISVYWTYSNNKSEIAQQTRPSWQLIWQRFPKFVIGFVAASLVFSFGVSAEKNEAIKGGLKNIQGLWFTLAFLCIGLETRFSELFQQQNKKPLLAFLIAQTFNIFVTLAVAIVLFK